MAQVKVSVALVNVMLIIVANNSLLQYFKVKSYGQKHEMQLQMVTRIQKKMEQKKVKATRRVQSQGGETRGECG